MSMAATTKSQKLIVKLLPATIDDVDALLDIGQRSFASDQLNATIRAQMSNDYATAIRRERLERTLPEGDHGMNYAKIVLEEHDKTNGEQKIVAWCSWRAAKAKEPKAAEQVPEKLKDAMAAMDSSLGGEVEKRLEAKSDELLGTDRDARYWYLRSLCTDPEYQGRGFASQLVKWGMDLARADAQARPGEVDGVYIVATPAGLRTYVKAGLKEIGDMVVDYGKGDGEDGFRLVWLVEKF